MSAAPDRLARALAGLARWSDRGVHFAPIRHHSPGCARALLAQLEAVQPRTVLIEGPREYDAVLTALQHPDTVPPVAVLSVNEGLAAFYPLAQFSPEWVALRWAGEHGATVEFIDRPYAQADPGEDDAAAIQEEHHLARSAALSQLAASLGCRDHNEVWEHLFEARATPDLDDWRSFFADVLAWAGLARIEADREALDADGTHAREAVMADRLQRHASHGPLVVVTGAFHTMPLLDVLDAAPEARWVLDQGVTDAHLEDPCWLIRYDFKRLDGLRGYAAGMAAPGFWQRAWEARHEVGTPRRFATDVVLEVITALRAGGEPLGTAQAKAAVEQVLRLANLRDRAWPCRTDVLDGLLSTLAKDDTGLSGALGHATAVVFAPTSLGAIPDGVASPPLVAEARAEASRLRFTLTDADARRMSLDTARKPRHRARREFLARMRFIGSGFARQVGGADLVTGTGLGQFIEEWEYAWTPLVETALINASGDGPTLDALLGTRIQERLNEDEVPVDGLTTLMAELVVMGETDRLPQVCSVLERRLADVPRLASVVLALRTLASLTDAGGRLSLGNQTERVLATRGQGLAVAAYLLPGLAGVDRSDLADSVEALVGLRDVLRHLPDDPAAASVARELDRLRADPATPALLRGCLVGLASTVGSATDDDVTGLTLAHLAPGTDPGDVADFLVGLLRAAPDALLHAPDRIRAVTVALTALPEEAFLAALPDLRMAFTALKPTETHRLAEQIAAQTGLRAAELDVVLGTDPELTRLAHQLEQELLTGLRRDGLGSWAAG